MLFVTSSIAFIAYGLIDEEGALATQNFILFGINLVGVYRYLIRKQPPHEAQPHERADSSKIDDESETSAAIAAHNRALAEELRERVAEAALGGPEKHRERHVARGKLLPRDRVERLLDPGSPFLEIGQLAACDMYDGEVPGAGHDRRHRPRLGPRGDDRRQRRRR